MKNFTKVISVFLILALVVLCQQILVNSAANQALKGDSSEINHIKWGLFSVEAWKDQLEVIVADEIRDFDFTRSNEKELRKQIEAQLSVLIDKVAQQIATKNGESVRGRIKQAFINAVVDVNDIKAGIPGYTDSIMTELKKAKTERQLKRVVKKQVAKYFDKTFEVQDRTDINHVLERMGTPEVEVAKARIAVNIADYQKLIEQQAWLMIALSAALFLLIGLQRERLSVWNYFALLATSLLLLASGVATPMIDMEAKISRMSFILLDHEVAFENQILYFQSKSIMDVFWLMLNHRELAMKFVGILVVTFSVVFPVTKLMAACLYYFDYRGARSNRFVRFFTLKSGKWSMSDVLVVAMFMAYVGFNGIIASQLTKLGTLAKDVELLTTNGTSLQPGFFLFLSYVLGGLVLATLLERRAEPDRRPDEPHPL